MQKKGFLQCLQFLQHLQAWEHTLSEVSPMKHHVDNLPFWHNFANKARRSLIV